MADTHFSGPIYVGGVRVIDENGNIDAPVTTTDLTTTGNTTLGNATSDTLAVNGNATFTGTATGNMADIVVTATTTGKGLDLSGNTALTTGILAHLSSSATAITGAGRLLYSNHTGATGTSATLNEFASAATDETVITKITASGALALGSALSISAAAATTAIVVNIADLDALTTGTGIKLYSNSADVSARFLLDVKNDNTAAVGALLARFVNDAPTSTNFFPLLRLNGFTLWAGNGNTPNAALSGTAGDWLIGGDSGKGYFCTGTTNWTAFA